MILTMYINTLIQQLIADPRGVLLFFLLALPGRLLAISAHEAAHGWVADWCGDPTARLMGRVSLNPLKHFDLVGTICLLLFGFGWAKPVPVNPNNFRNYRGDDLKVSLAGITMNLLLFLTGGLVMYAAIWAAMGQVSYFAYSSRATAEVFRTVYSGVDALVSGQYWVSISDLLAYPSLAADMLIAPVFGEVWSYVYQMIYYFVSVNLVLAVFNLIPVPPLDGYHALNDLVLKRPLFADQKAQGIGMAVMLVLVASGLLNEALNWVTDGVMTGAGRAVLALMRAAGIV